MTILYNGLSTIPSFITYSTNVFHFVPTTSADLGITTITINLADSFNANSYIFTVTVLSAPAPNTAPYFVSSLIDQTLQVN
jgi:hypothetical protein